MFVYFFCYMIKIRTFGAFILLTLLKVAPDTNKGKTHENKK